MKQLSKKIKQWKSNKTKDINEQMLKKRVEKSYQSKLPHSKLTLIPYTGEEEVIEYKYDDLIALCPVNFFPGFYQLKIRFVPNKLIPELRSLKLYLLDFLYLPISHEHLASKIYKEIKSQINPKQMHLSLELKIGYKYCFYFLRYLIKKIYLYLRKDKIIIGIKTSVEIQ